MKESAARLKGKVVNESGDPVERAMIMTRPDHRSMTPGMMVQRSRPAWGHTEADGVFLIENVEPGTFNITVDAEGYQQQKRQGIEFTPGGEYEFDFVLAAGSRVEGRVTTADGEPVAQAMISVSDQAGAFQGASTISANGQTDVEGRYQVTGAPSGPATVTVFQDGEQRLAKAVEVRPGTNVVDLVLERGFEITGQVVAPDTSPVSGAALSIRTTGQPGFAFSSSTGTITTAADGTFTLSVTRAGKYTVTATREGYAPSSSEALDVSGNISGLLIEMRPGVTLKGRVLGLELDDLASLTLVAFSQSGGMRQGQVDFSAEYTFADLGPGMWHLQAQVAGSGRSSTLQVEIPEGVTDFEKDIEFGTGFSLSGMVLDSGQPLVGASVTASGTAGSTAGGMGQGMSDSAGRFRIEGLKAGNYQFMVSAGMGIQHVESLDIVGDQELRIEISTGAISGTVHDATGEPLAGASVTLERLDASGDSVWDRMMGFGNQTESDSRGTFRMPRVRQGSWRVVATRSGHAPGEAVATVVGGGSSEVEIQLTPTEGVSFEVVLESGATVPSVTVAIFDPSGRRLTSRSYPVVDGRVRVSTVPPGLWELVIQGGDSAATRFAITSPGDQGRLVLRTAGILHIRIPELEGTQAAAVKLTGPDGKPFVSTMNIGFSAGEWVMSAGQSMVPGLVPGEWTFTVEHGGRTWSGSAMVTSGETTEVRLP